jgi:hypothetical protein
MVMHHTKDKGDLGIAKAHADLASKCLTVLFPAAEHARMTRMGQERNRHVVHLLSGDR